MTLRLAVHWRASSQMVTHLAPFEILARCTGACEAGPCAGNPADTGWQILHLHEVRSYLDPIPESSSIHIQTETIQSSWNIHPAIRLLSGWQKSLDHFHPDVLLALDEPYCLQTWRFLRYACRMKIPLIFLSCQNIEHNLPFPFAFLEKRVLQSARGGWFLNREARERAENLGWRGHSRVIPLGIDPDLFEEAFQHSRALRSANPSKPPPNFTVGYIGRLVSEKGIDDLIQACQRAHLPMRVIGSGPQENWLQGFAQEAGVEVDWMGEIPADKIPSVMTQLDVLVLPSLTTPTWKEQFGRVLVEAMGAGVPVIGSDSGEIPQVIGHAGLIFPEGNINALAESLSVLASNPIERARLARAGRDRALAHFTWHHIAADLHDLIKDCLG